MELPFVANINVYPSKGSLGNLVQAFLLWPYIVVALVCTATAVAGQNRVTDILDCLLIPF
jgi:hypothetical protein